MPRPNEQVADHLANRRVRALIAGSRASRARSAYAAYASTRDRERDSRVQVKAGQIPGRADQIEAGLLRDPDPARPHLGRSRDSQDQQRPGPRHGPPGLPVLPDGRANPGLSAARSNGSCGRLEAPVLGVKHVVRTPWRCHWSKQHVRHPGTGHRSSAGRRLRRSYLLSGCYGAVPGPGGFLNGGLRRDWSMMLNSR